MAGPPPVLGPSEVAAFVLADLALILAVARLVGGLFVKLNQPRVVGEIVAGILIGPTVLGGTLARAPMPPPGPGAEPVAAVAGTGLVNDLFPLQAFAFLNLLGQVALVFYMFLVGLELDQRLLRGRGRQIGVMASAVVAVPIGLAFAAGGFFDDPTWKPPGVSTTTFLLFLGAGLSVTAFPVMARILQEKGLMASTMGAVGVGAAAVVTVLMFLAIAAASASAAGSGVIAGVGIKLGLTVALIVVLLLVVRPIMGLLTRRWRPGQPLGTLLAVMLIGALATGLATDRFIGVALVGGFLFGAAVPATEGLAEAVIERMEDAVVLFFLPIFLAVSGLRTDLRLITLDLVPGLLLFLALMVVGKWAVGYLSGRAVGLRSNEANTIGVLLNCRGLLILVVALIGLGLTPPVITPQMQAVFVIGAIVTTLMTGPLVDVFARREEKAAERDRKISGSAVLAG
jgi:Kef-type K+ transport system membrane component KefB